MNTYRVISILLIIACATSCKKLIEIPANPPTAITQAEQFSDSITAMTAIAGVYSYPAGSIMYGFSEITECAGLSSDELSYTSGNIDNQQFFRYGLTQLNSIVSSLWSNIYTNIYPVNAVLTGVKESTGLPASFKTQIGGEMKVVRAMYYLNLVNFFGSVPLVLSTDYKQTARLPGSTADSAYDRIITDLTEAADSLSADYPSPGRARPNLYTALAFLSKAHLYRGDWQAAYNESDSVIKSGMYELEPDLNNVFLEGSNEAIWQLPANGTYNVTAEAADFVPYSGSIPNYLLTSFLLDAFEAGDLRMMNWVGKTTVNTGAGPKDYYYPYKYKNKQISSPTTENYMMFRLAEVYLIRAEAAAHLDKTDIALADLNVIRQRAGLDNSTASGKDEILNAVMHERQVELFTESGNRWFDLKRTGQADLILGTEKTGWHKEAALYPIPQSQMQLNSLLKQNPGY